MVEINLLPWREYTRLYQAKQMKKILFLTLTLCVIPVTGMVLVLTWHEKQLHARITELKKETGRYAVQKPLPAKQDRLDEAKTSKKYLDRQAATQKFFGELASISAANLCFTSVTRVMNKITFSGNARSAVDLTDFLTHWQAASFFSEIKIEQIEQQGHAFMRFRFQALENVS